MVERFEALVQFQCPKCSGSVGTSVQVDEPDWFDEDFGSTDAQSVTSVVCPTCGILPAHALTRGDTLVSVTLDGFPETGVVAGQLGYYDPDDYDFLDDYAADPVEIFNASYEQTCALLKEHGKAQGDYLINRMVFAHQVTALEAYLYDTIRKALNWHDSAVTRLAVRLGHPSSNVVPSAAAANSQLMSTKVNEYIKQTLYHNIVKVNEIYQTALDIQVLEDGPVKDRIVQAIRYRHDCVHRNGFDKDGTKLKVFTPDYVQNLADEMRSLVSRIEGEIVYQQHFGHPLPRPPQPAVQP